MELKEALEKIHYPQDKVVNKSTEDPEIIAFNEGWNTLYHQLRMMAIPPKPK